MNARLERLEEICGHQHKAAEALGISDRHYRRIKKKGTLTKTLDNLLTALLSDSSGRAAGSSEPARTQ